MSAQDLFPSLKYLAFSAVRRTLNSRATRKALNVFVDRDITDLNFLADAGTNRYIRPTMARPLWIDCKVIESKYKQIEPRVLFNLASIGSFAALIALEAHTLSDADIAKTMRISITLFNTLFLFPFMLSRSFIKKYRNRWKLLIDMRSAAAIEYAGIWYPHDLELQGHLYALDPLFRYYGDKKNHTFMYSQQHTIKLYFGRPNEHCYYTGCRNRCLEAIYAWLLCAKRLPLICPLPRLIADYVYNSIAYTEEWAKVPTSKSKTLKTL